MIYWDDIGIAVSAEVDGLAVNFKAYSFCREVISGVPHFFDCCNQFIEDIEGAEILFEGHVKWDGCSNWSFGDEGYGLHYCDRDSLTHLGEALSRCWDFTKENHPRWDG